LIAYPLLTFWTHNQVKFFTQMKPTIAYKTMLSAKASALSQPVEMLPIPMFATNVFTMARKLEIGGNWRSMPVRRPIERRSSPISMLEDALGKCMSHIRE